MSFSKTEKIVGTLTDVTSGTEKTLFQFDDDAAFERTMSAFFMDQLQLSQVNVFNSKNEGTSGTTVAHGWPWLSTALHIGSRTDVLFGETAVGGLPIRMMQMFVGVPAATTLADIKVAQGRQRSQNTVQDVSRQLQVTQRAARLTILRAQLAEIDGKTSTLRPIDSQRHELERASASFVTAERHYRLQLGKLATIEGAASEARAIYDQDRRLAQKFKEERAAGFVFRSLEPVCCPACDTGFDTVRRSDMHARHVCVVCGTDDAPTADSAGEQMLLDSSIAASHAALKAAESSLVQLQTDIAQARKAVDSRPGHPQRHGDDGLALEVCALQAGQAAVQEQMAGVRFAGREAGEPDAGVEERFEVQKRAMLVGIDDQRVPIDTLGFHIDRNGADGRDSYQKIRPLDLAAQGVGNRER